MEKERRIHYHPHYRLSTQRNYMTIILRYWYGLLSFLIQNEHDDPLC